MKTPTAFIFLFTSLMLSLVGCVPEKEDIGGLATIIQGRVQNLYSGEAIVVFPVVIKDEDADAGLFQWQFNYYDTVFTDSAGYYRYEFVNEVGCDYILQSAMTSDYYPSPNKEYRIVEGSDNTFNLSYKPYRNLWLRIVNKDKVWLRFSILNRRYHTTIPTGVFLDGLNIDTLVLMKFVPDLDIELSVMKINGNPDDVDAFKKESYYFLFNVGNKDTTLYFEY